MRINQNKFYLHEQRRSGVHVPDPSRTLLLVAHVKHLIHNVHTIIINNVYTLLLSYTCMFTYTYVCVCVCVCVHVHIHINMNLKFTGVGEDALNKNVPEREKKNVPELDGRQRGRVGGC